MEPAFLATVTSHSAFPKEKPTQKISPLLQSWIHNNQHGSYQMADTDGGMNRDKHAEQWLRKHKGCERHAAQGVTTCCGMHHGPNASQNRAPITLNSRHQTNLNVWILLGRHNIELTFQPRPWKQHELGWWSTVNKDQKVKKFYWPLTCTIGFSQAWEGFEIPVLAQCSIGKLLKKIQSKTYISLKKLTG